MNFKVEGNQERLVVRIMGDVTSECEEELKQALLELSQRKPAALVVDLSQVPFIDSTGLGVLVGLRAQFERLGSSFILSEPQPRVSETLRLLRLDQVFCIAKAS